MELFRHVVRLFFVHYSLPPRNVCCHLCFVSPQKVCTSSICGCGTRAVLTFSVDPQMFRYRGGSLPRAHSVGHPPWQCVTTRESIFRAYVVFLEFAAGCLPLFLPLRDTGLHTNEIDPVPFYLSWSPRLLTILSCLSSPAYCRRLFIAVV